MKYVMFDSPVHGFFPVLFPEHVEHVFIAESVNAWYPGVKRISAGFCNKNGGVYGESVGLKLKSLPGDSYWIKKTLSID